MGRPHILESMLRRWLDKQRQRHIQGLLTSGQIDALQLWMSWWQNMTPPRKNEWERYGNLDMPSSQFGQAELPQSCRAELWHPAALEATCLQAFHLTPDRGAHS